MLAILVLAGGVRKAPRSPLLLAGGACLLGVAAALGLSGAIGLGGGLTPFPKPSRRTRLVQTGIYGMIRHPLYAAVMSAAMGWSLWRQSGAALAVSAVLVVFLDAKARREERWLREHFPEYPEYERRVKRFIPGIY